VGLLVFLIGNFLPVRSHIWTNQETFEIGPWDSSSGSVDIPFGLFYSESVDVLVEFGSSATPANCVVWVLVNYQYPSKSLSEATLRFDGQQEVSFSFGWENVRYIPIFVTGFMIRLFYMGPDTVSVDVVITRIVNPITVTGLGFLAYSITVILGPIIIKRLRKVGTKEVEK
jgi:hypothetical protein